MVRPNRQYFVVKIDKALQNEKRNKLLSKNVGYFGMQHSVQEGDDKLDGVRVWDVDADSPAYHSGFKSGDIIKTIDEHPVTTYDQMASLMMGFRAGELITIGYISSFAIDRQAISTKQVTLGERKVELFLPPQLMDFGYNLQIGELIMAGDIAQQEFPEAEIGDMLIFHHFVEHKPRAEGDINHNDYHLVETDENGDEYRIVNFADELFGVLKVAQGLVIPYKKFIFCSPNIEKSSLQKNESGLWLADQWNASKQQNQDKIDHLAEVMKEIGTSHILKQKTNDKNYRRQEEIRKELLELSKERAEISKQMNRPRLVDLRVLYIHPDTCKELQTEIGAGDRIVAHYDMLYPLDIMGTQFTLLRKDWIEGVIHKN